MDGLPPPAAASAYIAPADCTPSMSQAAAEAVFKALKQSLPRTQFLEAWPSCLPGMVAVRLANGSVAYTDITARYLFIGLALDTATGKALDRQLEGRSD